MAEPIFVARKRENGRLRTEVDMAMKSILAVVASFLVSMSSLPVMPQDAVEMPFDLTAFWGMFVQVFEQISAISSSVREAWVWLMNELPASTVLWFTLGVFATVGYGLATMSAKVCKILMVVFWAIFIFFLVKAELHL